MRAAAFQLPAVLVAATLALLLCAAPAPSQQPPQQPTPSTEAALKAALLHQPLYLRGRWNPDRLAFDAAGHLLSAHVTRPYTLSGIDIDRIQLKPSGLLLEGHRAGVELTPTPVRKTLREKIQIEIAAPPSGDYAPLLHAIFANGLADLLPSGPPPITLAPPRNPAPGTASSPEPAAPGQTTPPTLLTSVNPLFTPAANELQYGGAVLVHVQLRSDGSIAALRVLQPIGLGLDEQALAAVARYRFKPATDHGAPVPSGLDIHVNFVPQTLPPASAVTID